MGKRLATAPRAIGRLIREGAMSEGVDVSEAMKSGILDPARIIPPPSTVSAEARARLTAAPPFSPPSLPVEDKAGWRALVEAGDAMLLSMMEMNAVPFPAEITTHQLGRTALYEVLPRNMTSASDHYAIFYVHGGAYLNGKGLAGALMSQPLASHAGLRALCVDYRMPPDHPFPAGLEDAVEAYRWALDHYKPENIVVAGGSAGGGLAAALILKVRDIGLPMPGAAVLATPESDLTEAGDSFKTNAYADVNGGGGSLAASIALYADGHDLRDPYLSPNFGDFSKGFPPTILTCGTRDIFLSNTVLLHRALLRARIDTELHVWEAMPHGGFFGAPEDQEVLAQQAQFIRKRLNLGRIEA
jgi:epsilon-lactone hydrolase